MKGKFILLSILALAILAACDRPANATSADAEEQVADKTSTSPASAQAGAKPMQSSAESRAGVPSADEAEALMLLMAVNDHEIAAAEQARGKKVDGATLEFANLMRDEHGKNQAETRRLIGASARAESGAVKEQKRKGAAELAKLSALNGDAYEKAYIDAMVKGHTDALAMLEARLIPAASTDAVRKHLSATREHVAMHLERARALQGDASR